MQIHEQCYLTCCYQALRITTNVSVIVKQMYLLEMETSDIRENGRG